MLLVFLLTVLLVLLITAHGEDIFGTYVESFFCARIFQNELQQQKQNNGEGGGEYLRKLGRVCNTLT